MTKRTRYVLAILFIAAIFVIGLFTAWNCRSTVKDIFVKHKVENVRDRIEDSIKNNFAWHNDWINLNGGFQRLLGVTVVRGAAGDTYKLSNGQIMYTLPKKNMKSYAEKVVKFRDELEKAGIPLMYVQYPFKIEDDSVMPMGTHVYGNSNADALVKLLRENNVDTLDIRDYIKEQNLDWASLFFKTDHHWKPTTGLWASGIMMQHVADTYGLDVDMSCYDLDNYEVTTYKDWMLGSIARRTGAWYDGVEDFDLLNPKFETDFSFKGKRSGETVKRSGPFWDSMYDFTNLEEKATFDFNTYSTYTGGQYRVAHFVNKNAKNDYRILMIRDSFSCTTTPFIAMNASEVVTIDMRRYTKSVLEYAKNHDFDLVMVAYNPSAFSKKQFDFCKDE